MKNKKLLPCTAAEGFSLLPRSADTDARADFCLTVTDGAMAPYICPGQSVAVSAGEALEEFDVGVFYCRGKIYCRQWCEDYSGALHLLAANSAQSNANIRLSKGERQGCLCLGKVLLDKRPPRPAAL